MGTVFRFIQISIRIGGWPLWKIIDLVMVVVDFEQAGRHAKACLQFTFVFLQAAGDVPFGMPEHRTDVFQWPAGVFTQRQHRQIFPFSLVIAGILVVDNFPEVIGGGQFDSGNWSIGRGD
jgi:hypothetical protein